MDSSPDQPWSGGPASRRPALAGALLVALCLFALLAVAAGWDREALLDEARRDFRADLTRQASALSDAVHVRAGLLFGLEGFVQANQGDPDRLGRRFESVAAALLQGFTCIRNVAVGQGTVYRWVYPLGGNEAIQGLDLLQSPQLQAREDTRRALETRRLTLSGPYELYQGGLGLVARKAVYQGQRFWGIVALAMDLPALLTEIRLPEHFHSYALRLGGRVFAGNPGIDPLEPVTVTVSLPEGSWTLSAVPDAGWEALVASRERSFWISGVIICLLLANLTYLLLRRQALLRENARLAERRSAAAEKQYQAIFEAMSDGIMLFDPTGRVVAANPAAASMHGYGPGMLDGRDGLELLHPDSAETFREFLVQTGSGRSFRCECLHLRRDGSSFPVQIRGVPFSLDGRPHLLAVVRDVSERNRLRRERERVIQLSSDLIAVLDFQGRFVDLNPAGSRALGLPLNEILNHPLPDFAHPEDREAIHEALDGLARQGLELSDFTSRYRSAGDEWRWLSWNAVPDPETRQIYAVARDVTALRENARQMEALNQELSSMNEELTAMNEDLVAEVARRERTEKELTDARERLEAILENMDSGVVVYEAVDDGLDFRIQRFNHGAERIEGLDRSLVLGRELTKAFPGAETFGLLEALRRVYRSGRPERLPMGFYQDGRITGWRSNFLYRLASGEVVTLYSDETERMKVQEALAGSEERFALAVHGSSDGIWDWPDCGSETQWWSPRFYVLLGYEDGEIPAGRRNLSLLLHPEDRGRVLATLEEHLDTEQPFEAECRLAVKGGGYRWFLLRGAARLGDDGRHRRMAGSLQDMTERKVAAQALTAANEQLAAANEEMTSINEELAATNDELLSEIHLRRQAEEQLQASLREKVVLLKEIHHRVKNNLQVVSSLLGLQAATVQDPKVLELFDEGKNRIASMALVHEELYRSPDLARVNMETYLERLVRRLISGQAVIRRVDYEVAVDDVQLPVDLAIPCGLVVNELVSNALKHGLKNRLQGRLTVTAARSGGLVRLRVADDGPGLPPDLDFRQTETLGMQLVVNLVSQLHGELELENGPGCVFRFVFPEKSP